MHKEEKPQAQIKFGNPSLGQHKRIKVALLGIAVGIYMHAYSISLFMAFITIIDVKLSHFCTTSFDKLKLPINESCIARKYDIPDTAIDFE